ncbi:Glyoxylate/hydroxypyruvate reductase A [Stylophora pistillata]|uniref:Glyoxylate/hydroxypyruvate reductase A n=2 Tax=Stylophora pistillata TaxID=50429 RepID=A0A2B4RH70_STYPI|nr:Glyoxylate/hydroxypyruvate reductase A [Stylophora pistillata]
MASACSRRVVKTIHISSIIPNLADNLTKRLPRIKFINVPVGCSGEVEMLQEAEVLLADPDTALTHLSKLSKLEWMQLTSAGVDKAIPYITSQQNSSLKLTRSGGIFGPAIAQNMEWRFNANYRVMPKLTIGILGLGDIGQYIAKMCKALGMTVWGVGRRENSERQDTVDHYTTTSRLPEVLQSCDYICNLLPSTPATKYLLSGRVLESGKDKCPVFINVGRGNVIDEKSLVYALDQGWISGAILDVFEVEPLPKESPLWKMPQVVITPHMGAFSFPEEVADLFVENLLLFEAGEKLKFEVDFEKGY